MAPAGVSIGRQGERECPVREREMSGGGCLAGERPGEWNAWRGKCSLTTDC
jgi:hypothetical protein